MKNNTADPNGYVLLLFSEHWSVAFIRMRMIYRMPSWKKKR